MNARRPFLLLSLSLLSCADGYKDSESVSPRPARFLPPPEPATRIVPEAFLYYSPELLMIQYDIEEVYRLPAENGYSIHPGDDKGKATNIPADGGATIGSSE